MELFVVLAIVVSFGLFMCWLCHKANKELEEQHKRQQKWRDDYAAWSARLDEQIKRSNEAARRFNNSRSSLTSRPHEERIKEFWDAKKAPVAPGPVRHVGSSKHVESSYGGRSTQQETDYVTPMIIAHSLSSSSSYSDDTSSRICSSSSSSSYSDSSSSYSDSSSSYSSSDSSSSCSSSSDY